MSIQYFLHSPALLIIGALVVYVLYSSLFTVEQQKIIIVERFGKFARIASPGLNFKIPFIEKASGRVSLRVQQLDVPVETKSKDNVFVKVAVSVQYHVLEDKVFEAFYKLADAKQQITAFVFDVVRARVPKMILDDVFEKKDEIADAVKAELSDIMTSLGYSIVKTLVTDIDPDSKVKAAMNEINEAQRLRVAANERGEAEKILKVKAAEADAESAALQGKGMADQRKAIIDGFKNSVSDFQKTVQNTQAGDVINLVLISQYLDTLKELGSAGNMNTILLPHSPSAVGDLTTQLRESLITANQVNNFSAQKGEQSKTSSPATTE